MFGGTVKVAEIVETHQRSISSWNKTAARVAVGQGKNGETDMKRIILAALVGVVVSGPVWAAEDDAVLLHCSGYIKKDSISQDHGGSRNIKIGRDGSWIIWTSDKITRTRVGRGSFRWIYEYRNLLSEEERIEFAPSEMVLIHFGGKNIMNLSCFPIENPLKF